MDMSDRVGSEPEQVVPADIDSLAATLRRATESSSMVQVVGGGTRQGYGSPPAPDIVLQMKAMSGIEVWDPDDMTVTVGAGMPVADLESSLAARSQTAVLPEVPGRSTVGGVIAAGASSLRRGRLLGTRERVLEATLVTGDGRIVRGGGRVVKNVTGYDLPRLVVGAFGSLGVIASVCLKLWSTPPASATVEIDDLEAAARVNRPLAVLEENGAKRVFLWGTHEEVAASSARLGGEVSPGHQWPADPSGGFRWSLRVPPALTSAAIAHLPPDWRYLAIHRVGEIRAASDTLGDAVDLRGWAEEKGGSLVVVDAPPEARDGLDPWGRPPPGLEIQRRLIAQFDPGRIINPGRLPGGI
jgi:glycolate oxidase FAD binding subunit